MRRYFGKHISFYNKIIIVTIGLVLVSTLTIGMVSQTIARHALDRRGKTILENSVMQAKDLIKSYYLQYDNGSMGESEAQETIKELLIGPMLEDGTRERTNNIDLGEHGYFIIYDQVGNEVMHPRIEGENKYNVTSITDPDFYIVQEQIKVAKEGGGFIYYDWYLPDADEIGSKISYGEYSQEWGWIVVATAYEIDFNSEADDILIINLLTLIVLSVLVGVVISRYVKSLTHPIITVSNGMKSVAKGIYDPIDIVTTSREIGHLGSGYNHMVDALVQAQKDLDQQNEKLRYLAFHDELTGLPNRYGMKEHMEAALSHARTGYLIQADILGLKAINSTLGYEQGNHLLKMIGHYFIESEKEAFLVSRTSSNEFTMWIENRSMRETKEKVEAIRQAIKDYIAGKGYNQMVDMYVSMACYPEQGDNFEELYEEASVAMKLAKDTKNLGISVYEPDMKAAVENELLMKKYLRQAIDEQEIVAYYQSKVDYLTEEVVGVEALARWQSEDLGFVSPGVFIPAITNLNLMSEFGAYMIKRVFSDYEALTRKYGPHIAVSINISPAYFIDMSFYDTLKDLLTAYEVPPDRVILEITEDVFISDYEDISTIIHKVHNLGVKISIDDFGTGYSSLNYLTNMDFDEMKIDKAFIDQIITDEKVFQMFEILCHIAEIYGYDIVAEGVETEHQLEKIKKTSLRVIQGYLFSKPEAL